MKKIIYVLLLSAGVCQADAKLYTNGLGLPAGSSYSIANTTFYTDALGLPFATSQRIANTDIYADSLNLPMGSGTSMGPNPLDIFSPPTTNTGSSYVLF
jgi:hypothetical protein